MILGSRKASFFYVYELQFGIIRDILMYYKEKKELIIKRKE